MDLNKLTAEQMDALADAHLFTEKYLGEGLHVAVPNRAYLRKGIPVYDWDSMQAAYIPRTPVSDWTPNA